jgi:hypothetical protein
MAQANSNIKIKVKAYLKKNWGSPFIVGFMLLLTCTTIFLSADLSFWADTFSVYAFYALVVGVLLQLVCSLKYSRKPNEAESF